MPGMSKDIQREVTCLLVKPDGVRRGLVGQVITRLEHKGLTIDAARVLIATSEQIEENYRDNANEPWFREMVAYMTSGPIWALAGSGPNAIDSGRQIVGVKDPWQSDSGSIRGEYAADPIRTIIHGSRTAAEALREINLWFPPLLGVEEPEPKGAAVPAFADPLARCKPYHNQGMSGMLVFTKSFEVLLPR